MIKSCDSIDIICVMSNRRVGTCDTIVCDLRKDSVTSEDHGNKIPILPFILYINCPFEAASVYEMLGMLAISYCS